MSNQNQSKTAFDYRRKYNNTNDIITFKRINTEVYIPYFIIIYEMESWFEYLSRSMRYLLNW